MQALQGLDADAFQNFKIARVSRVTCAAGFQPGLCQLGVKELDTKLVSYGAPSCPPVVGRGLLAGQVQALFDNLPGSTGHIRTGKVRALGVTASKRVSALPDVPTIAETVPGYEASVWYGIAAPKGTPPDIIATLNQAVNAVLVDPKLQARPQLNSESW